MVDLNEVSEEEIEKVCEKSLEEGDVTKPELSHEQILNALMGIEHMAHFEWREAALEVCPDVDPQELVEKYWEIVGRDTADSYVTRLDKTDPTFVRDVANSIAFSSVAMGEDAKVIKGRSEMEYYVRWDRCPWYEYGRRYDAVEEDLPGCDKWCEVVIERINKYFGTDLKFETIKAHPLGDDCCLRRIWSEENPAEKYKDWDTPIEP
ncbi:hypothetical protein AKJ61_03180 [candidate division MSBL1 archaeon SCGC-AAA259B11]|uniref:L-2-amino-thiazoline-4-carboxylic acid hydrolase n=1 Tax=candidate division MSBL1 archaeon SCGC-AAA259B11 TaxID=1698260 RepID=A0A133U535_9EURY|nr:hypothetical protein AKJ61_03180 [candidate division MSBL1 archaeon SCGC-AAA259B11]